MLFIHFLKNDNTSKNLTFALFGQFYFDTFSFCFSKLPLFLKMMHSLTWSAAYKVHTDVWRWEKVYSEVSAMMGG